MKLELKEYQVDAYEKLLDEIENAMSRHSKKPEKIFAISLASPTGSGKTIIMTSVLFQMQQFCGLVILAILTSKQSERCQCTRVTSKKASLFQLQMR